MPKKMPDKAYWIKRAETLLLYSEKTELEYEKDLKKAYEAAKFQVTKEMEAFYGKYATNGKISLADAKSKLNPKQLKAFQQQAQVYLDEIDSIGGNKIATNAYNAYLKSMSSKAYVSKLNEIEMNIRHQLEKLAFKQDEGLGDTMTQVYEDSLYMTVFDVQKQANFGVDFTQPGKQQLETAVKERWVGSNYSDSIWQNKDKLVKNLSFLLSQEFVRGHGPNEVAKELADRLDVSYSNAKRLARTEINYIANKGRMQGFKDSGIVTEFEYCATLDARTSEICQEMDGQVFEIKQAQPGVNQPPLHPYCRSTTIPFFADDEISDYIVDRAARGADGKTYHLGKDVTYNEWVGKHATAEYAKKVNTAPEVYEELMPPPLDIKDYGEDEYEEYLATADTLLDKYNQHEIINAAVDWKKKNLGITTALAYGSYDIAQMAHKIGLFDDMTEWFGNPLLVNMKLHGYTKDEAFGMVLTGEPTAHAAKWANDNGILESEFMNSISDALYSGGSSFSPEEMLKYINDAYKTYNPDSKKTFYDMASKKDAHWSYDLLYKEFKSYYNVVAVPATYLNDVIKGKYATIEEAKAAKVEYQKKIDAASKAKKEKEKLEKAVAKMAMDGEEISTYTLEELQSLYETTDFEYSRTKADEKYRPWTVEDWKKWTKKEQAAAYKYTSGSGAFNRPLVGYEGGWGEYNYKGPHAVDLNYEGQKAGIAELYKAIDKTSVPETIKVRRGGSYLELFSRKSGILRHLLPSGSTAGDMSMDAADVYDNVEKFKGQAIKIDNFLSTGIAKDAGFSGEVEYRILLPKGSKATYAEPYSHFGAETGNGQNSYYTGSDDPASYVGSEAEVIIQAGTQYIIRDIKKSTGKGSLYIELIVIPESQKVVPERIEELL